MKHKDRKEFGLSLINYCKDRGLNDKEISIVLTNARLQIKEILKIKEIK